MMKHNPVVTVLVAFGMILLLSLFVPETARGALMLRMNLPYNVNAKNVSGAVILATDPPAEAVNAETFAKSQQVAVKEPEIAPKAPEVASTAPQVAPKTSDGPEYVRFVDGWECERPKKTGDLLQPSGLWMLDEIECHKLEMTVEEWKAQYQN